MAQFTLDGGAAGAQAIGSGIGDALRAAVTGNRVQQDAYLKTMGHVKNAEEARGLRMTNDHRANVDNMLTDPTMDAYRKAQLIAFKLAGPQYMDNFSKSGEIEQGNESRQAIINDPSLATNVAKAFFATSGKAPFDNVGDTGYAMNKVTGEAIAANPVMAKLFQATEGSLANQRNASAGEHAARRDRVNSGLDHTVTTLDENGRPMVTALPTKGGTNMIAPAKPTSSGLDATNAKAYNQIVTQVEKEMPGAADEKVQAEVDKRWARRVPTGTNKNPAPAAARATITPTAEMLKVQADFRSGKITREQAKAKLKELGMNE